VIPSQRTMSVAKLMRKFQPVEQIQSLNHNWTAETAWITANHPRRLARLRQSIRKHGIVEPIRLCYGHESCGEQRHVVDGHHRIVIAQELGIRRVPVGDAWEEGSDWMYGMDDNPGDDPEVRS